MNLAGVKVTWQYGKKTVLPGSKKENKHKTTTCIIDSPVHLHAEVTVSKHHNDVEDKEKARVLSLSRAMQAAGINKEQRTAMWLDYKNSKQGGRW